MRDLSIVIPARNEMWLSRTVEDILSHIEADTEVIVVLDGAPADPPVPVHERVKVIELTESIGQRAATNMAVRESTAKYIMKLDAHCAMDQGFDRKMIEGMQDNWTMVPAMRNLHVFNWVCPNGHSRYQGPSGVCTECGEPTERDVVWIPKTNPLSTSYCFDPTPHFQYNNEFKKTKEYQNGVVIGYDVLFSSGVPFRVIEMLAHLASTHEFTSSQYDSWCRQNMPIDAVSLSSVNFCGGIGTSKVESIRNKTKMLWVDASTIIADMVNHFDVLSSPSRDISDQPCVRNPVRETFLPEMVTPCISSFVDSTNPIPAPCYVINSDIIDKLCDVIGGKFINAEGGSVFHNGSVTLKVRYDKNINTTMSLQGSCFMLTREKYWELNICDESFGSWGSQGIEVAVKTWLSGGEVRVNKNTWYAHLFRTQGGDFGFPYPLSGIQVAQAKKTARDLFFEGKWEKQVRPLSWLVERFWPVHGWTDADLATLKASEGIKRGAIYYADGTAPKGIQDTVQAHIKYAIDDIVSCTLVPMDMGHNIVLDAERGYITMHKQILAALEASTADVVYFTEHDVVYHSSHFTFVPPRRDTFYYNTNIWNLRLDDGFMVRTDDCRKLSQMVCYRELAVEHFKKRVAYLESGGDMRRLGFEPGTQRRVPELNAQSERFESEYPNIDVRHSGNLTRSKWSPSDFRNKKYAEGWREAYSVDGWDMPDLLGKLKSN